MFPGLGLGGSATVPCMGGNQEFGARGEPGCETEVSRRPALHRPTKAVPSVGCCENRATEGILAMESPQRPPRSAPPRGGMVPRETERPRQKAGRRGCGPSWFLYSRPLCPWIQPTAGGQHPGEKPCDCTSVRDSSSCSIAVVALRSTTDSCVHSISISHWVF